MKKLIVLTLSILALTYIANAQVNKTIVNDIVYTAKGTVADTVKLSGNPITYTIYVKDWADGVMLGVESDSVRGSQNTRTIIAASLNNVNYVNLDTVTIAVNGNDKWGISDYLNPKMPYIKITTSQVTSSGTTRIKYYLLINKN